MIFSKAKNFLLAALVGLSGGLVSCEDENYIPQSANLEKDFILTVDAPEGFRSRANQYFGDGAMNELHLKYAIYGIGGEVLYSSDDAGSPKASAIDNGRWQLKLRLADGIDYKAFFWADQFGTGASNPYSVDLAKAHLSVDYKKAFTPLNLESDRCDAYAVYQSFVAANGLTFTMKRPFCQVNVGSPEPSVVDGNSAYHNKRVTVSWDDNTLITGLSFADGSVERSNLAPVTDPDTYPDQWPGMKISDFDNAGFKFIDSEDSKFMYMAYLLVSGQEKMLNLHIEGTDENFTYKPDVTGKVAQNSRLIVVPKWVDGGDGFIDPRDRNLTFIIRYDPGFSGDDDNIISEEVKVDVFHTLTWTLGDGVKSVLIDGKVYTENGSLDILEGTKVDWEVTPEEGYEVDGAESGFVTMTGDQSLNFTASWMDVYYTLSWTINEGISFIRINGTKYNTSGSMQLIEGAKVDWSASPESGYNVTIPAGGTFFMNSDRELSPSATPTPTEWLFQWFIDEGVESITVNGSSYTGSSWIWVPEGDLVSWSAVAKDGYSINGSSSGSIYVYDNYTLSVTSSAGSTVDPDPESYTFSWSGDNGVSSVTVNGSSYGASGSISVNKGASVSYTAYAKPGYKFVGSSSGSVIVNSNEHVDFSTTPDSPVSPDKVTFSWSMDEGVQSVNVNGLTFTSSNSISVDKGSTVSWSATAKPGYTIVSNESGSVTMDRDKGVDIKTKKDEVVVPDPEYTFSWSGDDGVQSVTVNGSSYGASGSITVKKGASVSWSATAKSGYEFSGSSSGSATINADKHVDFSTVKKSYPFSWTLDEGVASITVNGTTYTDSGSIDVQAGSTVSWSATAKSGYDLMPGSSGGSMTINGSASVTVSSKKQVKYCTITWSIDSGVESITVNGRSFTRAGSMQVEVGSTVSWSATPKSGYEIINGGYGDTFQVLEGAEGGVISITVSTQRIGV